MIFLSPGADAVWKFALPLADEVEVEMPEGSVPVSLGLQTIGGGITLPNGQQQVAVVLWAAVASDAPKRSHRFFWRATGQPLGEAAQGQFVGTMPIPGGPEFHLFLARANEDRLQ